MRLAVALGAAIGLGGCGLDAGGTAETGRGFDPTTTQAKSPTDTVSAMKTPGATQTPSVPTPDAGALQMPPGPMPDAGAIQPPDAMRLPPAMPDALPDRVPAPDLRPDSQPPPVPVPDPALPNLILNGDFERDLSAWTDLNNQVRVMPGIGVNASKAARFDPTFDPAGATWDAIGQILIVAPNTTYTFGAIASSTAGAGAVIVFEVGYADKTSTPVTIEIGREYKVHQAILKTKDKPGWASLQIRHYGGGGVLTIDNVFVQPRD